MNDVERPDGRAPADADGLTVARTPRSIGVIRRYVTDTCRAHGWGDSADTVALLVSEVATNAVLHAHGPEIRVRVLDLGPRLRIEVHDDSPALPAPREAHADAEDGRGVALMEALAAGWGVEVRPQGKTIWVEVGEEAQDDRPSTSSTGVDAPDERQRPEVDEAAAALSRAVAGVARDRRARERDQRGDERDERADERDELATAREAAGDLKGALKDRESSESDRKAAEADRHQADVDRLHAAADHDA